ncbi:hypothetical protein DNTS_008407 [Danionella cerebrum]|uniref:Transmembrane protein 65 n=1 Tax=Danionella cerebrum TaxID=2873325 RepID=A0A553MTT1_9TELE|nr:hypothetical protein DNTS_008407 [Danionella translucida]TRY56578.1 hypothetical protein DNTS_008407 [Danionella translucida]TRY56579.1 hypothetical protein DNTS_008407 [Danionella translucida]
MLRSAAFRAFRLVPESGQLSRRMLGTHRRKIKLDQLELPNQAREFVYSLSPANRNRLLKELQNFQSNSEGYRPLRVTVTELWRNMVPMGRSSGFTLEPLLLWCPVSHRETVCLSDLAMLIVVSFSAAGEHVFTVSSFLPPSPAPGNGEHHSGEASPLTAAQLRYSESLPLANCCGSSLNVLNLLSPPTPSLSAVLLHNAIPFIGFGFLDNAIMIAAGTQIELSIGLTLGISTMAAAALGNLVSDLAGLGLAGYVEALAARLGMQIPDLCPKQVDMWQTRVASHTGKAIGVAIGCILGMFPLLFFSDEEEEKEK